MALIVCKFHSSIVEVMAQCVHAWESWKKWQRTPPNEHTFPHKSACVLGDTWLSKSKLLSTWSLFLSSKELRITGFIFPTLVLFMNTL